MKWAFLWGLGGLFAFSPMAYSDDSSPDRLKTLEERRDSEQVSDLRLEPGANLLELEGRPEIELDTNRPINDETAESLISDGEEITLATPEDVLSGIFDADKNVSFSEIFLAWEAVEEYSLKEKKDEQLFEMGSNEILGDSLEDFDSEASLLQVEIGMIAELDVSLNELPKKENPYINDGRSREIENPYILSTAGSNVLLVQSQFDSDSNSSSAFSSKSNFLGDDFEPQNQESVRESFEPNPLLKRLNEPMKIIDRVGR